MSGIIGPLTTGRIAFAVGAIGIGALIGGAVAERSDRSVTTGTLLGASSALAGVALLVGGAAAMRHAAPARTEWRALAASLFREASTAATLRAAPTIVVPTIARTPALPVATTAASTSSLMTGGSGSTFLSTMVRFLPG